MQEELYHLEQNVDLVYVAANAFPEGIMEAHQTLHAQVSFTKDRKYFGLSRPNEKGIITYYAAAEVLNAEEAKELGLKTLTLPKGDYFSIVVRNYVSDIQSIGIAFQQLISRTGIDPQGYCVEWYINDRDMRCMVKQKSS